MYKNHIKIGSIRTCYWISPASDAPTIVLLHEGGYGGNAHNTFASIVPYLETKYQLILPDMLGYGETDKAYFFGEDPYSPRLRHLEELYSVLGIDRAHFVGNSFGGGMALNSAVYGATKHRVQSVISISGTGGPFRSPEGLRILQEYIPTLDNAKLLDGLILKNPEEYSQHTSDRFQSSISPGQWEAVMALRALKSPLGHAPRSQLPGQSPELFSKIEIPSLLIAGKEDPLMEKDWELKMQTYMKDTQTIKVDGSHAPQIENPQEIAGIIDRFIEAIEGDAS